jgi:hypothetical protein
MRYTTTKSAEIVLRELSERERQQGLMVIENESGTVQVEATTDEIDDFERLGNPAVDSDVVSDELMEKLVDHLKQESLLETN